MNENVVSENGQVEVAAVEEKRSVFQAAVIPGGQEKFGLVVKGVLDGAGLAAEFGPFDTEDRALAEAAKFDSLGLTVDIRTIWTCSSVRHFLAQAAKDKKAAAFAAEVAAVEAKVAPEAERARKIADDFLARQEVAAESVAAVAPVVVDEGAVTAEEVEAGHEEALVENEARDADVFAKTLSEVVTENEPENEPEVVVEEPVVAPVEEAVAVPKPRARRTRKAAVAPEAANV